MILHEAPKTQIRAYARIQQQRRHFNRRKSRISRRKHRTVVIESYRTARHERAGAHPLVIVAMGVSGCGKSTVTATPPLSVFAAA